MEVLSIHLTQDCVCVRLCRHSNRGLRTKGTIGSPVGKRTPFAKHVQNI